MAISRNARSLPDFPEFAQQLGMVSPELPRLGRSLGLRPVGDLHGHRQRGRAGEWHADRLGDLLGRFSHFYPWERWSIGRTALRRSP